MAVDAVTVADNEQVESLLAAHVRRQCISVLVDLVRIARLVTAGCCEGEFCDGIKTLGRI